MAHITPKPDMDPATERAFADSCRRDPILAGWLSPNHLDPRPLRAAAAVRTLCSWAVADDFFRLDRIAELAAAHSSLDFEDDDVGLNYHSTAVRTDKLADAPAAELLNSMSWRRYVSFVVGAPAAHDRTVVKFRRHPPRARGFWPHTDQDTADRKVAAVLAYLNPGWRAEDGGLLQLWHAVGPLDQAAEARALRWNDYKCRPLDFLATSTNLEIELVAEDGGRLTQIRLLDQIVPAFNRVVFLDFLRSPAFHSVTVSGDRPRDGFLQWLFEGPKRLTAPPSAF
jgi:hypothetical protein